MKNLDSILKSRGITLPTKVQIVKAMVFPACMYRYESWTIKKAKHWRIDAFELWCWRRLLRVPWTARRSNQSILNEFSQPWIFIGGSDAEASVLWPPDAKRWVIGRVLMLRKIEGERKRGQQRIRWVGSITNLMDMNLSKLKDREIVKDREAWRAVVPGVAESQTWLNNTTLKKKIDVKHLNHYLLTSYS